MHILKAGGSWLGGKSTNRALLNSGLLASTLAIDGFDGEIGEGGFGPLEMMVMLGGLQDAYQETKEGMKGISDEEEYENYKKSVMRVFKSTTILFGSAAMLAVTLGIIPSSVPLLLVIGAAVGAALIFTAAYSYYKAPNHTLRLAKDLGPLAKEQSLGFAVSKFTSIVTKEAERAGIILEKGEIEPLLKKLVAFELSKDSPELMAAAKSVLTQNANCVLGEENAKYLQSLLIESAGPEVAELLKNDILKRSLKVANTLVHESKASGVNVDQLYKRYCQETENTSTLVANRASNKLEEITKKVAIEAMVEVVYSVIKDKSQDTIGAHTKQAIRKEIATPLVENQVNIKEFMGRVGRELKDERGPDIFKKIEGLVKEILKEHGKTRSPERVRSPT
jgi:hypothetical protein